MAKVRGLVPAEGPASALHIWLNQHGFFKATTCVPCCLILSSFSKRNGNFRLTYNDVRLEFPRTAIFCRVHLWKRHLFRNCPIKFHILRGSALSFRTCGCQIVYRYRDFKYYLRLFRSIRSRKRLHLLSRSSNEQC